MEWLQRFTEHLEQRNFTDPCRSLCPIQYMGLVSDKLDVLRDAGQNLSRARFKAGRYYLLRSVFQVAYGIFVDIGNLVKGWAFLFFCLFIVGF